MATVTWEEKIIEERRIEFSLDELKDLIVSYIESHTLHRRGAADSVNDAPWKITVDDQGATVYIVKRTNRYETEGNI